MSSGVSLKLNVVANYVGQFYIAAINILLLPAQVRVLGSEAYGLVGFFAMLSGWLQLLDIGLSPTLARETAKYRAGGLDKDSYRQLLHSVGALFFCLSVAVGLLVFALSEPISRHWLHLQSLSPDTVADAVAMMGLVFALRWQATPSRSVLVGLERQVWVNVINTVFATLRSVGVLGVLHWFAPTPRTFFVYQGAIAAVELGVLQFIVHRCLALGLPTRASVGIAPLRRVASFSLTIAFAAFVAVSGTQLDNLLLSKFLPLSEYAWFSLAVMAAGGINLLSGPIGQAVQPRLTYLNASSDERGLRAMYSDATQMLSAIALTASFALAFGARPLLWAWTGNAELAARTAPVLSFYALGNGFLAVVAMTYYLQIARGDLRLHLRGNLTFAVLLLPTIIVATLSGGMLGASLAWCGANLTFLLVWSAIVHRRFLPGHHLRWLMRDALLPGLIGAAGSLPLQLVPWAALSRPLTALVLAGVGTLAAGLAVLVTNPARRAIKRFGNVREAAG